MRKRLLLIISFVVAQSAIAQGPLNPPGAPGATMKTLDQVEPRVPIDSLPFTITSRGSYYLTRDLVGAASTVGITIQASNVTLNLMGFTLGGVVNSSAGIQVSGNRKNVVIKNGFIRLWDAAGLSATTTVDSRLEGVHFEINGSNFFPSPGADLGDRWQVKDCQFVGNHGNGLECGNECVVSDCLVENNDDHGITVDDDCSIRDCNVSSDRDGIQVNGTRNKIENNHVQGCARGINGVGTGNYFSNNFVRGNSGNYSFAAGNEINLLICQIPQFIGWPCQATLSGSLTGLTGLYGVEISADDVTLDLNGHSLVGVPGSTDGIVVNGTRRNITVMNGVVRDWDDDGIDADSTEACTIRDVNVSGCDNNGIHTGNRSRIEDCIVDNIGREGINAGSVSRVVNCTISLCGSGGLQVKDTAIVDGCIVNNCQGHAIAVGGYCVVKNNLCDFPVNENKAIYVVGSGNVVKDNTVTRHRFGVSLLGSGNTVFRNAAHGNTDDYDFGTGNDAGPESTAGSTSNPWANITY